MVTFEGFSSDFYPISYLGSLQAEFYDNGCYQEWINGTIQSH